MREHYEKRGRSIRLERSADSSWFVRLDERGIAERDDTTFTARGAPTSDGPGTTPTRNEVERLAARICETIPSGISIERLVVVAGTATHRIRRGRSRAEWSERSVRVHLSLANHRQRTRGSIDLGGRRGGSISIDPVRRVASALGRVARPHPLHAPFLHLEPAVAAALWSSLLAHPATRTQSRRGPALRIAQAALDDATRDGNGDEIRPGPLLENGVLVPVWPNVFRPSYRLPPRPAPMHVRVSVDGPRQVDGPVAVGLVEPPRIENDRLRLTLLVEANERVRTASLDMPVGDWIERVVSIADDAIWFPFGGGSWGARTTLEDVRLA